MVRTAVKHSKNLFHVHNLKSQRGYKPHERHSPSYSAALSFQTSSMYLTPERAVAETLLTCANSVSDLKTGSVVLCFDEVLALSVGTPAFLQFSLIFSQFHC